MKRFLSSCARLPRIGFAVGVALLLGSLAVSAHAELMFIGDVGENTITAVGTNTLNYAPASALLDGSGMIDLTAGRVTMNSKAYQQSWATGWLADYGGVYGNNGSILLAPQQNLWVQTACSHGLCPEVVKVCTSLAVPICRCVCVASRAWFWPAVSQPPPA